MPREAGSRPDLTIRSASADAAAEHAGARAKIFVSYSRKDLAFAEELVAGLVLTGFEPIVDKLGIAAGEDWEARLARLIEGADTIVYVISPDSIASQRCTWEVERTVMLNKRLLPIVWRSVDEARVPERLKRLNYIYFDKPHSFAPALADLAKALRTDLTWVREHTRLLNRAQEWQAASRAENRLLSGQDIVDAKEWLAQPPSEGLKPTELHRDFIQTSDQEESDRRSAERRRADVLQRAVRRAQVALTGALVLLVAAVATGLWAWQARQSLAVKVDELKVANERLEKLEAQQAKVSDILERHQTTLTLSDDERQQIEEFKKLAGPDLERRLGSENFVKLESLRRLVEASASVGVVSIRGLSRGSGFLVRGSDLSRDLGDETLFLTAAHVYGPLTGADDELTVALPGLEHQAGLGGARTRVVWYSPVEELDAVLLRLVDLPPDARPIAGAITLGTAQEITQELRGGRISIIGYPQGELLPVSGFEGANGEFVDAGWKHQADTDAVYIQYSAVTRSGSSGGPVFETNGWRVVGMHQRGSREDGLPALSGKPGRVQANEGISIAAIAAAVDRAMKQKKEPVPGASRPVQDLPGSQR